MSIIVRRSTSRPAAAAPVWLHLLPGRYKWCACGFSHTQPFCDHTHREMSELKSVKFEIETERDIEFCLCKQTKTPPFCDASHESLDTNLFAE